MGLLSLTTLAILFIMGRQHVAPIVVMAVSQANIFAMLLYVVAKMTWFVWHLPKILLRRLVHEMKDQRLLWRDGLGLSKDLSAVFSYIDSDRTGSLTMDEVVKALRENGLSWDEEDLARFQRNFFTVTGDDGACTDVDMDLDRFRSYFKELFGGKLVRHMNRAMLSRVKEE